MAILFHYIFKNLKIWQKNEEKFCSEPTSPGYFTIQYISGSRFFKREFSRAPRNYLFPSILPPWNFLVFYINHTKYIKMNSKFLLSLTHSLFSLDIFLFSLSLFYTYLRSLSLSFFSIFNHSPYLSLSLYWIYITGTYLVWN